MLDLMTFKIDHWLLDNSLLLMLTFSIHYLLCVVPDLQSRIVTPPCSPSVHWSPVPGLSSPQAADSWEVVTSVMRTQLCSGSRHRNLSLMSLSPTKWPPGASPERRETRWQRLRIIRGNNPLHDASILHQGGSWGLSISIQRSLQSYR